ncbi:MAG: hypothetical protein Q9167_004502 [Letrouitia subvulpina]
MCCSGDIFLALLAILFPPIAVWIKVGLCTADSVINIALCMLGFIPGLLHAWYIIAKYPDPCDPDGYEPVPEDTESGRVTYYYVSDSRRNSRTQLRSQAPQQQLYPHYQHQAGPQQGQGAGMGYGTVPSMDAEPLPLPPSQQAGGQWGGEGSAGAVPPSYEQAIQGDHKVQT